MIHTIYKNNYNLKIISHRQCVFIVPLRVLIFDKQKKNLDLRSTLMEID